MQQTVDDAGALEIAEKEGIVLGPYLDSVGYWTDGVGNTVFAGGHDPGQSKKEDTRKWSQARVDAAILDALRVFDKNLGQYEARVRKAVKKPLKQHQFNALVSWDLNTGGATYRSRSGNPAKLISQINSGDMSGDGFMGWLKPKEIIGRRKQEMALFRTGDYAANGDEIPVYDALGDGRIRYRTAMSGAELSRLMNKVGAKHKVAHSNKSGGLVKALVALLSALFKPQKKGTST